MRLLRKLSDRNMKNKTIIRGTYFDYVKEKGSNLDLKRDLWGHYIAFVWLVLQFTCHISAKVLPNFSHFACRCCGCCDSFLFQLLHQKKGLPFPLAQLEACSQKVYEYHFYESCFSNDPHTHRFQKNSM